MLTDIQKMTLRDVFRQTGIAEYRIENIFLLLKYKPKKVQLCFYYASIGYQQDRIAREIESNSRQVRRYIKRDCKDIREYLLDTAYNRA